jgi:leader peptidase (prepilin peptidase)/N-methyltransferase
LIISEHMVAGIAFLLGLFVGSFLNVVIWRVPRGESIVTPRSRCPECFRQIAWYDNIPVLSFILLRGRCRYCGAKISWRYPVVELISGFLALGMVWRFGVKLEALIYFAFAASLLSASVIDLYHKIIPDQVSLGGMLAGMMLSLLPDGVHPTESLAGAAAGFFVIFLLIEVYRILTRREGMGLGDAKLLGMIGAFLGWRALPGVVLIGSLTGLLGAGYMILFRHKGRFYKIPFGPFLSTGAVAWVFMGYLIEGQVKEIIFY